MLLEIPLAAQPALALLLASLLAQVTPEYIESLKDLGGWGFVIFESALLAFLFYSGRLARGKELDDERAARKEAESEARDRFEQVNRLVGEYNQLFRDLMSAQFAAGSLRGPGTPPGKETSGGSYGGPYGGGDDRERN